MIVLEENMAPGFFDEYKRLIEDKQDFIDSLTFGEPWYPDTINVGDTVRFETTDMDDTPVNSADIFADAKVTLINLWGTNCCACKEELPELEEMSKEYAEQGVRIVLVCCDADDPEKKALAKQIFEERGCTLPNLASFDSIERALPCTGTPTSFFVDSEGHLLAEPLLGAHPDKYREIIADRLEKNRRIIETVSDRCVLYGIQRSALYVICAERHGKNLSIV